MIKGNLCTTCRNLTIDADLDYTDAEFYRYEIGWGELAWHQHKNGGVITFDQDEPEFLDMSARCLICDTDEAGDFYAVTFTAN